MSVIDWSTKPEPWRSMGPKFAAECRRIAGGYRPTEPPIPDHVLAGRRLQDYRLRARLRQADLAKISGYSEESISAVERGRRNAGENMRQCLAQALGFPVEKIWPHAKKGASANV